MENDKQALINLP